MRPALGGGSAGFSHSLKKLSMVYEMAIRNGDISADGARKIFAALVRRGFVVLVNSGKNDVVERNILKTSNK